MTNSKDDWTASAGALEAVLHSLTWRAELALSPGKLAQADADEMRRLRDDIQVTLQRLQDVLSRIAGHSKSDAAEVEHCVARLLHNADWIWHLHPLPTPNVRKRVQGEPRGHGRTEKAKKARTKEVNEIREAVFSARIKQWNGKKIGKFINTTNNIINNKLADAGIDRKFETNTTYKRFQSYRKARGLIS